MLARGLKGFFYHQEDTLFYSIQSIKSRSNWENVDKGDKTITEDTLNAEGLN